MKECPKCRKVYADDLSYCLDDGTPLAPVSAVDRDAKTEAAFDSDASLKTEVLPGGHSLVTEERPRPGPTTPAAFPAITQPQTVTGHSNLLYIAIGGLLVTCLILVGALLYLNFDRLRPISNSNTVSDQPAKNTSLASPTQPGTTPTPNRQVTPQPGRSTVSEADKTLEPTGTWRGEWSTASGSLFDFDLTLNQGSGNNLSGQIRWTMRRTARPDKQSKVGVSATEYVRGTYDPSSATVNMAGYGKDDPENMLVMLDVYKLNLSPDNRSLTGLARNGGKWNGRVRLTRVMDRD